VTLSYNDHNIRLNIEDGDEAVFDRVDLGDQNIPYETVTVERDGDTYYIQGETDFLNMAYNMYPDIEDEDARKAQLAKDWPRIARVANEAYGDIFNEQVPAGPRFRYSPDLGSVDTTSLTSSKVRHAIYEQEDQLSAAQAIRSGALYELVRNNITAAEDDSDDDDLD
jgi:hypothetical protein